MFHRLMQRTGERRGPGFGVRSPQLTASWTWRRRAAARRCLSGRSLYPLSCPWQPGWPRSSRASCASPIPGGADIPAQCRPSLAWASGPSPPSHHRPSSPATSRIGSRIWPGPGRHLPEPWEGVDAGRGGALAEGISADGPLSKAHEAHLTAAGQNCPSSTASPPLLPPAAPSSRTSALSDEGGRGNKYEEALRIITQRNALLFSSHRLPSAPTAARTSAWQRLRRERHPRS